MNGGLSNNSRREASARIQPETRGRAMVIERFEFRGFHGRGAWCRLEFIPLTDGRTLVIAIELLDNPGTSVTNVAEHLASHVCDEFGIDPDRLVWVEHYGYGPDRTYDLVTFSRREKEAVQWFPAVLRQHPDGWPGYFEEPDWRPMRDEDWRAMGLTHALE
jgi:hypothetical protein